MDAILFIGIVIAAITQMIKMAVPQIKGWITILVAFCVSILVGVFGPIIGVVPITVAEAIVAGFSAIGMTTLASKAGGGAAGDAR